MNNAELKDALRTLQYSAYGIDIRDAEEIDDCIAKIEKSVNEVRLVTIEECAKVCDRIAGDDRSFHDSRYRRAAGHCAANIRNLKKEKTK